MANPRSPDWRSIGDETSAPAPVGNRPWQPGDAPEPTRGGQGLKRIAALLALLLVLVGIGWVLVLLRKPQPAALVAIGSGYEHNLLVPHNVGGWNGLIRLLKNKQINRQEPPLPWAQPIGMRKFGNSDEPIELRQKPWKEIWNSLNVRTQKEKTLVLFLSAQGLAEADDVYLVPNVETLRELGQSLVSFKEIVQLANSVRDRKVVLFLDVDPHAPHWLAATQKYDFVERLQFNFEDKLGNLVVVCAAGPGERAWTSEELQSSVFTHFATQGLLGDAIPGERGVIKLTKLHDYLVERVDQWARTHRARTQKPRLLGKVSPKDDIDLVYIDTPYANKEEPTGSFSPDLLKSDWEAWERLRDMHAHIYSPHLWRQYQDTLVRYEQLMRCGDPTSKAEDLKRVLKSLDREMTEARLLAPAFDSLASNLVLHRVLGYPSAIDGKAMGTLVDEYRKNASDEKKRAALLEPYKARSSREQQLMQVLFGASLLDRSADYQQDHAIVREVEKSLGLRSDPKTVRPVELQLHTMLQHADPGMKDMLMLAVQVRRLAEEAALSMPSTPGRGESVAYSEVIANWTRKDIAAADEERRQGEDLLFGDPAKVGAEARKKLENARALYKKVRDEAAEWRAALTVRDEALADLPYLGQWLAFAPMGSSIMEEARELREKFDQLGDDLSKLVAALEARKLTADPPRTLTQKIAKSHAELRERFEMIAKRAPEAANQRNWHEINHALSVPFVDAERRGELLAKLKKVSSGLHGIGEPEASEDLKARVDRQREIASKCLASAGLFLEEPNFDRIRDFYQAMADKIVEHTRAKTEKREPLQVASHLCRLIPPGIVRANAGEPFHPVERLRRLQMGDLLYTQAERACRDHWFDGDADKPYFKVSAKSCLHGTLELMKGDSLYPDLLIKVASFEKREFADAKLEIQGDAKTQPWTTEPGYAMPWKITRRGTLPEGKAMAWVDLPGLPRRAIEWSASGMEAVPFATLKEAEMWGKRPDKYGTVALQAIFRGQLVRTDIVFHRPSPDVTVKQPAPPSTGSLAIRRDPSFDYGAISIILDNSGSMAWVPLKDEVLPEAGKPSRFDFAIKAMDQVLNKIPNNTMLSVFRFVEDRNTRWGTGVEAMREPAPWQKFGKQALRSDLQEMSNNRKKYLKGGSPIADAIIRSMKDGFPVDYTGPRVILVLTDGKDNDARDIVQDRLQRAGVFKSDVDVIMVCFIDPESNDFAEARKQFDGIREITAEPDGDLLGQKLLDFLHPRVQLADKTPGSAPIFYNVGVEKPEWKAAQTKPYLGKIARTDTKEVDVLIQPGDNLFVVPKRIDRKFVLERGLLAEQQKEVEYLPRRPQVRGDWLVALFKSRIDNFNKLEQLITFEKRPPRNATVLQQVHPGFVWLELKGIAEKDRPGRLTWWNSWDVAAPAYQLERVNWPAGLAEPSLASWFWPDSRESLLLDDTIVRPFKLESWVADDRKLFEIQDIEWNLSANKMILRAAFTPGAPVLFALRHPSPGVSVQHDYYSSSGRVTAYFEGLPNNPLGAEFLAIDITRFKESNRVQNAVFETRVPPSFDAPEYFLRPRKGS